MSARTPKLLLLKGGRNANTPLAPDQKREAVAKTHGGPTTKLKKAQNPEGVAGTPALESPTLELAGFTPGDADADGSIVQRLVPLTEEERREREMRLDGMPRELLRVAEYLENYDGSCDEDSDSFEYGSLAAWLDLAPKHNNANRDKLLEMIRRLEHASSMKSHWLRLYRDVCEARQAALKEKRLVRCSFGGIVLDAMLIALMPVARASAAEIKNAADRVRSAAENLAAELRELRGIGMDVRRFLPVSEEVIEQLNHPGSSYSSARIGASFALRRYRQELGFVRESYDIESAERTVSSSIIAHTVCDTDSTLAILDAISERAENYLHEGVRRRSLAGDKRVAWDVAQELATRFKRHFGSPRYERAAAIAGAATGVQVSDKSLREVMEREGRPSARNRKSRKELAGRSPAGTRNRNP